MRSILLVLLVLTFILILMGGLVHGTGSSLACPDWPLCYGEFFPRMQGGVAIEHSHRLVASLVGLLTLIFFLKTLRDSKVSSKFKKLSLFAFLLVVFQGVLGGITVIYRLPTLVSTAHLGASMLFLAALFYLFLTINQNSTHENQTSIPPCAHHFSLILLVLVYVQILLGALVKHTGASLACLEIPFCQGSLWPSGGSGLLYLHMTHRLVGMGLGILLLGFPIYLKVKNISSHQPIWLLIILTAAQITLGFLSVYTYLDLPVALGHLGVGALLLLTLVYISIRVKASP